MKQTVNQACVEFYTIAHKEVNRFLRIWIQTLIPPVITTTLYFIIFGKFLGKNIPNISLPGLKVSYISFIVPGLIMMSVITASYINVVSSFFSARFQRHIDEIMVSPTSNFTLLCGYLSGGILRGLLIGVIVGAVSIFFTHLHIKHIGLMLFIIVLTATLFSIAGFINGLFARKFDDIGVIPTFVLTPLTYLGGVFYSVSLLPPFWQHASKLNPVWYMINAFRHSFLGVSDLDIGYALTVMILTTAGFFILALFLLYKGIGLRN